MTEARLPYFDFLLAELARANPAVEKSFGRHVHWGYWPRPEDYHGGAANFAVAAEALTLELCKMAEIAEGQHVLDVGCGFGGAIASLNERFSRLNLTGLNIDERQLERARRLVLPAKENQIVFQQGDACALPFADASFDRVLAIECIFHFPSREAFFREAFRVLKPGGYLTISDFVPSRLFLPLALLSQISTLRSRFNAFGQVKIDCTSSHYRRLAGETGFFVTEDRDITENTLPTYAYLGGLLASSPVGALGQKLFRGLLSMQRFVAQSGLLQYRLLRFHKP